MASKSDILNGCNSASPLFELSDKYWRKSDGEREEFLRLLGELHNNGDVDVLNLYSVSQVTALEKNQFFEAKQLFCDVLSRLECDVARAMECVRSLVERAGNDLTSQDPKIAFRDWCTLKPKRAFEAIAIIERSANDDFGLLSFSLEATAEHDIERFVTKSISLVGGGADELRIAAINALARVDLTKEQRLRDDTIAALTEATTLHDDDLTRANVVHALMGYYSRSPDQDRCEIMTLLEPLLQRGGDRTLYACAMALRQHHEILCDENVNTFLLALLDVDPNHLGTIENLDFALTRILRSSNRELIFGFLEKLLIANRSVLSLDTFSALARHVVTSDHDTLNWLIVRWFLKGDYVLCDGISAVICQVGGDPIEFDIEFEPFQLSDKELIFFSRKVIGFLFLTPVTAASILVCVIRCARRDTANIISQYLFDPILLNFSGETRDYLVKKEKSKSDSGRKFINHALKLLDDYFDEMKDIDDVHELRPSERQRSIESEKRNDAMLAALKKAHEQSILMSVVQSYVVLYGNRLIEHVATGVGDEKRRIDVPMQSHGTSIEWPRLEVVDPVGLDYMLHVFRFERLRE